MRREERKENAQREKGSQTSSVEGRQGGRPKEEQCGKLGEELLLRPLPSML